MFNLEELKIGLKSMLYKNIDNYLNAYFAYLKGQNDAIKLNRKQIITININQGTNKKGR